MISIIITLLKLSSYHEDAYEQHIVRIDRNKEIILNSTPVEPISTLRNKPPLTRYLGVGWHYNPETECHIAS